MSKRAKKWVQSFPSFEAKSIQPKADPVHSATVRAAPDMLQAIQTWYEERCFVGRTGWATEGERLLIEALGKARSGS